jgi:hypothetical protein
MLLLRGNLSINEFDYTFAIPVLVVLYCLIYTRKRRGTSGEERVKLILKNNPKCLRDKNKPPPSRGCVYLLEIYNKLNLGFSSMQLHTGAAHFGNVIIRGIAKRGCS